jgi:hypothetical protein
MPDTKPYWASRPVLEMLKEADQKAEKFYEWLRTRGRLNLMRLSLREYYAGSETGGRLGTIGDADEFTTIKVNHYHNLGEHIVTAIAGQPPAFQPQALNNDHESTSEVTLAGGILETAVTQKGLDWVFADVTRKAVVLSEGVVTCSWDQGKGEPYAKDPDTGQVVTTGDVTYRVYDPTSAIRDVAKESGEDHEWWILRRFEDRHNVAARAMKSAPDEETAKAWRGRIMSLPSKIEEEAKRARLVAIDNTLESDDIAVYELRHAKTDALPEGRLTVFVSPEVYLEDGPLKYREPYVFRMTPEEQIGSERGYSQAFDLLAPQHAVNASYSAQTSALSTLGHPVIWAKPGANVDTEISKAFTLLKCAEKPEAILLVQGELLKNHGEYAANLVGQMEIISGVNAVRRGNLEETGKLSGAAYALIDAKFLESVVGLQRSFKAVAASVATATIELYQDFAQAEQTLRIVGKSNRAQVQTWTGERLKRVSRVEVEIANPLQRTTSGRLQLVDMLMKVVDGQGRPIIKTPEQIMQVVTTGRLEPVTEGPSKELDNIKAENEMLGEGQPPVAIAIDNHPTHIEEHSGVLSSPESRSDQQVVGAVLQHIQEHMDLWTTTDVRTLAARGIPPPPMPPPPPGMALPGAPGATSGTPPPIPGDTSTTAGAPPPDGAGDQPGMPRMPTNPGTGEQAPQPPVM